MESPSGYRLPVLSPVPFTSLPCSPCRVVLVEFSLRDIPCVVLMVADFVGKYISWPTLFCFLKKDGYKD